MHDWLHTLLAVAALFWLALLVGRQVFQWHLPRVTGYLLVGLAAGPSLSHLLGYPALLKTADLQRLAPLTDIALALIMLAIGMHFRSEHLRRWRHRIAILSLSEVAATFLLVALAVTALNLFVAQQTLGSTLAQSSVYLGLFLGVIAIATAPAATLLVIREYESDGPVTDAVTTLIGLNNLASILAFNLACHFLLASDTPPTRLLYTLFLPPVLGGAIGFGMSVWAERLRTTSESQLLMLGGAIGTAGLCQWLGLDALLGCFACGAVLANASARESDLLNAMRQLDYPLYLLFFVLAGANLHLDLLAQIGILGIGYVLLRTAGKLLGARMGAQLGDFGDRHRQWAGPALLAQAGVAIGLSTHLAQLWPGGGELVQTVVLGAVVVFELSGPVAVRLALVRAGEVPVLALLARKAPVATFESLHHVVTHFRQALGVPSGHQLESPGDILVEHVMRKNVDTLHDATPFNELLRLIAHSRYDRFPVVDEQNHFHGIIVYEDIRDIVVDPSLGNLVIAIDLARPDHPLAHPGQTLAEILVLFREHPNLSFLPVTDEDDQNRLLGVLGQNDVLATFRQSE